MRLTIGITRGERAPTPYAAALAAHGADIWEIAAGTPAGDEAVAEPAKVLARLDGLLLPGGADIHPRTYGAATVHPTVRIDAARDAVELALCRAALGAGVPVLGICRGIQVLNVAAGGTLWQDIAAERARSLRHLEPAEGRDRRRHLHTVQGGGSALAERLLGGEPVAVNSIHHQGVRDLAAGLRIGARSPDGLAEWIEAVGFPFIVGVQWHPEELSAEARHAGLFAAFCAAAAR